MIIALYLRLSKDDENLKKDLKSESNSILNQKMLLESFVNGKDELRDSEIITMIDDGYSGTTFNRPNVKKMLDMASNKEIDCIIVKDFSRFGRNYVEVSDYLDQIFPFLGIRFISVNDNYDSNALQGKTSGVDVAFKNIIYNYYSKDLSKKIRSSKKTKALKGEYLSPYAPFGYEKDIHNKNKLVIEKQSSKVVVDIFKLACDGKKTTEIAKILNENKTPSRSAFKNKDYKRKNDKVLWTSSNVASILRDERYLGKTVYNKKVRPKLGVNRVVSISKEDWIVVNDTHIPLVSEEVFNKAQEVMRTFKSNKGRKKEVHIFSKKLKCGECGYSLARAKRNGIKYYCEARYNKFNSNCTTELIKEEDISKTILKSIKTYIALFLEKDLIQHICKKNNIVAELENEIKGYKDQLSKYDNKKNELYDEYLKVHITRDTFIKSREELKLEKEWISNKICELEELLLQEVKRENFMSENNLKKEKLIDCLGLDELTRDMVTYFVNCIYIYNDKRFEVVWNFENIGLT